MRGATSTSRWSTPRRPPAISAWRSPSRTADLRTRPWCCCRRSGSPTAGRGDARGRGTCGRRTSRRWWRPGRTRLTWRTRRWGSFVFPSRPWVAAVPELIFTENETNTERLYGKPNAGPYCKDAFHDYVVGKRADAVNPARRGTKAAALYRLDVPAGGELRLRLRLAEVTPAGGGGEGVAPPFADFEAVLEARRAEADAFYAKKTCALAPDERLVVRQAYAGLLWTQQFYHYEVRAWLDGDPTMPPPPASRLAGRNAEWRHLYNRDVISMPDKWEYPWYAAWDLAFHMIPFARIDPSFAKEQLILLTREWYMHPNGQLPAYEYAFGDVNPPVHAWAAWRVYKIAVRRRRPARSRLSRADVSQAAPQLHLVGQPQGRGGAQPVLGRFSRTRQHRHLRSLEAAANGRLPRAGRRHRLDGLLLPDDAVDGAGAGQDRSGVRGHGLEVLRALHPHRRRDEHASAGPASGTTPTASTTTGCTSKGTRRRCAFARWWGSCRSSPSRCWTRR